jgi:FMN phosphatase YigB (HAD superfamily)
MRKINNVLFDLGGVLTPDPMETLLFHEQGICGQLGVDPAIVLAGLETVWKKYDREFGGKDKDFWAEVSDLAGVAIASELVAETFDNVMTVNPEATQVIATLRSQNTRVGLISNNTAFFYPMQQQALGIDKLIDPHLIFLSHDVGKSKGSGLFEHAARWVTASETLVVDDRLNNIERSQQVGFHALYYHMDQGSLYDALQQAIR